MKEYILFILVVSVFWGCQSSKDAKYISFEEVKYIRDFPYSTELNELPSDIDDIGLREIKVVGDSILVLDCGKNWSIYSADDEKKYGHFLSLGQGPDELLNIPYVGTALFEMIQDTLWAYIPDQYNKRIMSFNISEFIKSGNQILRPIYKNDSLLVPKWAFIPFNSKEFMILDPVDDYHGLKRMVVNGNSFTEIPITESLSKHYVRDGVNDLNLISSVLRYDTNADKFVETMVSLNQINVYSRDGLSGITICVGDKLDNLADLEDASRYKRPFAYINSFANKFGFGAIYSGHTQNPLEGKDTELQFFNWNYDPIYRVKLPYNAFGLDIDVTHMKLWVVDKDEDVLRCYDATPIVEAYRCKNSGSQ